VLVGDHDGVQEGDVEADSVALWVSDVDVDWDGAPKLGDGDPLGDGLGVAVAELVTYASNQVAAAAVVGLNVTIASMEGAENAHEPEPDITVPTDSMPPARDPVDRDRNVYRAGLLTPAVTLNDASDGDKLPRVLEHTWPV
jgi:hypothetical protein